jgi:acyl transferase domain-containing protein
MDATEIRQLMEEQLRLSRRLRARIRELEAERHAPLAVIGMGLRLPGGLDSPEDYWDFLRGDATGYGPIPPDRPGLSAVYDPVPGQPGRSYVAQAGFLRDIAGFDADFFGISQREAKRLDPQQRMLLETAWEALERAGIAVRRSDRLNIGVYLGMMASEYTERFEDRTDMSGVDPYYTTGGGLCFAAGRISHVMGFRGPAFTVDTACSSSLSALHLAVRGLRDGECRYALVCGTNLLLSARLMVSLSQARALSPTGRSKSFLASADGYGRGEGIGVLALMRLDEAEREGRPILAVVRGTAVNHDGEAAGLTVPSGPAQQEVIRAALADAGLEPHDLGWIEAHGTGTVLGDPIEAAALGAVLSDAVRERGIPLSIGSVKSRLGHLEAASGIAAVMKTVLMLQHGEIPAAASPADGELNPHIPWDELGFTVPRHNQRWPEPLRERRVAGVNSFGMSGTNAHAVLAAYDGPAGPAGSPRRECGGTQPAGGDCIPAGPGGDLLTLSARTPGSLAELAQAVRDYLLRSDADALPSICHTLRTGRAPFGHRISVTAAAPAELAEEIAVAVRRHLADPVPVPPVRSATLRVSGAADSIAAGCAALASAFPLLAVQATGDRDPGATLAGMLRRFGVRISLMRDGKGPVPAWLEWGTGGARDFHPVIGEQPAAAGHLLLRALGAGFSAGADLRFDALRTPQARLVGDLPTYPFQRNRFWVDEQPVSVNGSRPRDGAQDRPASVPGNRDAVTACLMAMLKDVLDAPEEPDPAAAFLDTGADSFIFALFITKVETRYHVGLGREDLPLDLPVGELISRLADDIAGSARVSAGEGHA